MADNEESSQLNLIPEAFSNLMIRVENLEKCYKDLKNALGKLNYLDQHNVSIDFQDAFRNFESLQQVEKEEEPFELEFEATKSKSLIKLPRAENSKSLIDSLSASKLGAEKSQSLIELPSAAKTLSKRVSFSHIKNGRKPFGHIFLETDYDKLSSFNSRILSNKWDNLTYNQYKAIKANQMKLKQGKYYKNFKQ